MGFDRRENARVCTPQEGDTLRSIAERETAAGNPITWQEIARFNWGTDDEATVNEFLRDEMGARRRDAGNNFVLSTEDEPRSDLLLPVRFKKTGLALQQTHVLRVRRQTAPPQFLECCAIPGATFAYDKSFLRPSVADHLQPLADALANHPEARLMIFGHTDRVGTEAYNKALSERRARSVFAFITNDADTWEALYNEEMWGVAVIQEILQDLGDPAFDPGPANGIYGAQTRTAVSNFQEAQGLTVDGDAGPETRKALFAEYMASKHDVDAAPDRFMDPGHMGCGEFNPVEDTEAAHEPNRRVTFFLFHPDRLPNLPCRHGDLAPCHRQIDPPVPRHTPSFACSFFDSIAHRCACEAGGATLQTLTVRLLDGEMKAIPHARYRMTLGTQEVRDGEAGPDGRFTETDVPLAGSCTVAWGHADEVTATSGSFPYQVDLFLQFDQGDDLQTASQRLHNLGYGLAETLEQRIRRFQIDYKIFPVTGQLDAATLALLIAVHDGGLASDEV